MAQHQGACSPLHWNSSWGYKGHKGNTPGGIQRQHDGLGQNGADFSAGSPFSLPLPDFSDDDSVDSRQPKFMDIKREPSFEDPDQSTVSTYKVIHCKIL